jgi:hypothetical protein
MKTIKLFLAKTGEEGMSNGDAIVFGLGVLCAILIPAALIKIIK